MWAKCGIKQQKRRVKSGPWVCLFIEAPYFFRSFGSGGRSSKAPDCETDGNRAVHVGVDQKQRVSIISAYHARQFAKATGRYAKTDAVDAAMLADLGASLKPAVTPALDPKIQRLRSFTRRRLQLIDAQRIQQIQKNRLEIRELIRTADNLLNTISTEIEKIDEAGHDFAEANPDLRWRREILMSVKRNRTCKRTTAHRRASGTRHAQQKASRTELACFCPQHDMLLVARVGRVWADPTCELYCERCEAVKSSLPGAWSDVQARILREVDANLRTGEWKNGIERAEKRRFMRKHVG